MLLPSLIVTEIMVMDTAITNTRASTAAAIKSRDRFEATKNMPAVTMSVYTGVSVMTTRLLSETIVTIGILITAIATVTLQITAAITMIADTVTITAAMVNTNLATMTGGPINIIGSGKNE